MAKHAAAPVPQDAPSENSRRVVSQRPVSESETSHETRKGKNLIMPPDAHAGRYAATFFLIMAAWMILDRVSKMQFSSMTPGGVIAGPYAGLVDLRLVHNTGAAWGIFSDSTFALGIFSIVVCVVITIYFLVTIRQSNAIMAIGFGMVVAGGLGNAVDRFAFGYVTDFIEFSFMDFPVFNVADIGVTVGFLFVVIGLIVSWRRQSKRKSE